MKKAEESLYRIVSPNGYTVYIRAASGNQAKRRYCKANGISAGDWACGVSALSAHKLKPDEAAAYEENAQDRYDTLTFIKGMMDIAVAARR